MDFLHTVVPVAYCDIVLLDGRWRDQVDRLRRRLQQVGRPLQLATALSGDAAPAQLVQILERAPSG